MLVVRANLQFEGFDNATQPQKPHWESCGLSLLFLTRVKMLTAASMPGGKLNTVFSRPVLAQVDLTELTYTFEEDKLEGDEN